jgi:hypothetical protein
MCTRDKSIIEIYKGWTIRYGSTITGAYRANRYGVGLGNSTLESVRKMIDVKNKELAKPLFSKD